MFSFSKHEGGAGSAVDWVGHDAPLVASGDIGALLRVQAMQLEPRSGGAFADRV